MFIISGREITQPWYLLWLKVNHCPWRKQMEISNRSRNSDEIHDIIPSRLKKKICDGNAELTIDAEIG
jgi:hypothetical protein